MKESLFNPEGHNDLKSKEEVLTKKTEILGQQLTELGDVAYELGNLVEEFASTVRAVDFSLMHWNLAKKDVAEAIIEQEQELAVSNEAGKTQFAMPKDAAKQHKIITYGTLYDLGHRYAKIAEIMEADIEEVKRFIARYWLLRDSKGNIINGRQQSRRPEASNVRKPSLAQSLATNAQNDWFDAEMRNLLDLPQPKLTKIELREAPRDMLDVHLLNDYLSGKYSFDDMEAKHNISRGCATSRIYRMVEPLRVHSLKSRK